MADRWIVTSHLFNEHDTAEAASQEAHRLRGIAPGKRFRVLRVKTTLHRSNAESLIAGLVAALGPLLGEATAQIAALEQLTAATADAGALAVARTHAPNGIIAAPLGGPDDRTPARPAAVPPEPNPAHVQHPPDQTENANR